MQENRLTVSISSRIATSPVRCRNYCVVYILKSHKNRIMLLNRYIIILLLGFVYVHPSGTAEAQTAELFDDLEFRYIGPSRGGRVTTVTGHRDAPETFYMGATGGGVWKTTDYGASWENISDGYFETGSIGSIDVADSNPQIIYVGTGSDGIRSNVIIGRGMLSP